MLSNTKDEQNIDLSSLEALRLSFICPKYEKPVNQSSKGIVALQLMGMLNTPKYSLTHLGGHLLSGSMIRGGDKILVISLKGKDSLTELRILELGERVLIRQGGLNNIRLKMISGHISLFLHNSDLKSNKR